MTSKMVVAFLLLVGSITAVNSLHIPGFVNGKPLRYHLDGIRLPGNAATDKCTKETWFSQVVDHFDPSNKDMWNQRVQVNSKFFNASITDRPLIFLMIGGESPAEQKWVCNEAYTYMKLAKDNSALVIQLEHRFFGKSYPYVKNSTMGDMSTSTLRLLTSQQALEDLANFIQNYKFNGNITFTNPRWIVFGGSYPGSLCAWFRADPRYSNLTLGGICSSAPLLPKVDFYEYAEVMEFAFKNWSAIQKTNCDQLLTQGFALLRKNTYTDSGRAMLNSMFNITPPLNAAMDNYDLYATNFLANIFNVFQGIDQYTFDARDNITEGGYNIDNLCRKMIASPSDPLTGIKNIFFWDPKNSSKSGPQYLDNDYYGDVAQFNQSYYDYSNDTAADNAAGRGWMWLCCGMALGWLQTTDNSNGMFNRAINLNFYLQMCTDYFGPDINTMSITNKVAQIAYTFPAPWNYTATNVVLPNGDYDPWHSLSSYVNNDTRHQVSLLTHGAAHCSDMYPVWPNEPLALNATRQRVITEVNYYITLNPANNQASSTAPTGSSTIGSTTTSSANFLLPSLLLLFVTFSIC
uniref:Uncharacterized protein n=1 Tax=Panagrolaimus sp. PS1159 TaxID=55785 RepID=A0AC35FYX5_9BILA